MSNKAERRQRFIRHYKEVTGETDVDMRKVAAMALKMGWKPPRPVSDVDRLARQFTNAARIEYRTDEVTGQPYRVNHALRVPQGQNKQLHLWIDIDDPATTRNKMLKCITLRREQMIGDGYQMTLDVAHWGRIRPDEEPIEVVLDIGPDVAWRLNAPKDEKKAS